MESTHTNDIITLTLQQYMSLITLPVHLYRTVVLEAAFHVAGDVVIVLLFPFRFVINARFP